MKQSIECRLYFWILKRIGSERDSRPKHITAWTKNVAEKFSMRLHSSACVCALKIKCPDASRCKNFCVQTSLLFKDFRDVLYSCPRST